MRSCTSIRIPVEVSTVRANMEATADTMEMSMEITIETMMIDATGDKMIMEGAINMVTTEMNMIRIMIETKLLLAAELITRMSTEDKGDQAGTTTMMIANTIEIRMSSRRTTARMTQVKIAQAIQSECTSHGSQQN